MFLQLGCSNMYTYYAEHLYQFFNKAKNCNRTLCYTVHTCLRQRRLVSNGSCMQCNTTPSGGIGFSKKDSPWRPETYGHIHQPSSSANQIKKNFICMNTKTYPRNQQWKYFLRIILVEYFSESSENWRKHWRKLKFGVEKA